MDGGYLYIKSDSRLSIWDVADPSKPVRSSAIDIPYFVPGAMVVENGYAYLKGTKYSSQSGVRWGTLNVVDVRDSVNPRVQGQTLLEVSNGIVAKAGDVLYMWGGDHSGVELVDVAVPSRPILLGMHLTDRDVKDLVTLGDHAYIDAGDYGLLSVTVEEWFPR